MTTALNRAQPRDMLAASRAAPGAASARLKAIGLMLGAVLSFSFLDASAKVLTGQLDTLQIVWARYLTHLLFALVLFNPFTNTGLFKSRNWTLEIVRGFLLLASTACNFVALRYLQLDETTTIIFAAPLLVATLAGPMLGEWIGPRRWAAIVVGFLGVLIVLKPGFGGLHWAASFSVLSMICYAFYSITTRKLAGVDGDGTMLVVSALVAMLALTPVVPFVWRTPDSLLAWALLGLTGVFGGFGHWLLIRAHRLAPASILMPFTYSQIVWMVLLGYLVFHDVPTGSTLLGAGVVIASGLYLLHRERVRAQRLKGA